MAAAVARPMSAFRDDQIMDTRTPSPPVPQANVGDAPSTTTDEPYTPDLSNEVSMLSTKLINAINHQTNLDDTLQSTRHELDWSRQELKRVKAEKQSLDDAITQGVLVKKIEMDKTIAKLRADLALEKASREQAEKARKQAEGELADLTASLFEEANKMVADARKDTDAAERRNSQLKGQLNDTEVILASQQEQLQDLKLTMEKLERVDTNARESSVPSTPINSTTAVLDAMLNSPSATGAPPDLSPDHPLHFSQLIIPILRTDVVAHTDFAELLSWARKSAIYSQSHSRNASGNMGSSQSQTNLNAMTTTAAAASSSPNLPGAFSFGASSANNSPSSATFNNSYTLIPPLKESKFYKRTLLEDIEPTLRLDLAPGLSFLSRRTVNSAFLNGTLAVEPFTPPTKFYSPIFACALCGESRKQEVYQRRHRFKTSESDDAQRYPLCEYCLGRIRAAADFVGFLRMVRDGLWRCGSEDEERAAWEEAVRLRERMFWARIGGGVIPTALQRMTTVEPGSATAVKSEGRRSLDSISETGNNTAQDDGPDSKISEDIAPAKEGDGSVEKTSVNVASAEASSAVPELLPEEAERTQQASLSEEPDDNDVNKRTAAALHEAVEKRRSLLYSPTQPVLYAETSFSTTESQQDQADADAQLRREDTQEMVTPPETPQVEVRADDDDTPSIDTMRPSNPRTLSEASGSSSRNLSPSKPGNEERRPSSSSSVLARVRAMEGKGGK